jgi:hypothetical protein
MGCCDSKHQEDTKWLNTKKPYQKTKKTIAGGSAEVPLYIIKKRNKAQMA